MYLRTIRWSFFSIFVAFAAYYIALIQSIPSRLQAQEAPASAFGFVRVDKFSVLDEHTSPHGIDIIFVHGLGSNPDTTWGPKDSNWISQFLPTDIPVALHKDVRIFFYNYDSYWKRDAVQTRLRNLGESLLGDMNSGIRRTEDVGIPDSTKQGLGAETHCTPHRGSSFSVFGSIAARLLRPLGSNPLLLQELVSDSYFLLDLQKDFERTTRKTLRIVNFFEQRPTRHKVLRVIQWKQFVGLSSLFAKQSATYGKENFGLSVDHYGLNKYKSREDVNYKRILGALLEILKPIALQKQHWMYSVPFTIVESFVERHSLSAAIEEKLSVHHQGTSVPHAVAIYGLGGAGKTQLARKYIEDYKYEYNPILWIDARDEESAVLKWFRNRKRMDEGNQGSIIITSQNSNPWKRMRGYEDIEVGIMEPLEAKTLLLKHLKLDVDVAIEDVLEGCDKIARELGYLALAIDLAGAYISNNRDPI
ncbi:hypothetical protein N0V90_005924 [Kalmusia sp. IMI 367209]|nr:hypothetical protein N0V90_005924 [Kalmusia sp. IMI 367209]